MTTKTNRISPVILWFDIAFGVVVWGCGLGYWLTTHKSFELRNQLITLSPAFLWIGWLALILALWLNRSFLREEIREICTGRQWLTVAGVCLVAFGLVRGVAPRTHRLFYDEDIYEAIALNIDQNNQAAMNNDGRWEYGHFHALNMEFNKQPNGWPFVISLAYRIFGVSEDVAFDLANFLFLVAVLAVFVAGKLLFDDFPAALFGAFIYATIPVNIRWFSTLDGDPPTACFTILAVVFTLLFFRRKNKSTFFLAVSAWAWVCQFRFEVILLGGLVLAMFGIEDREELKSPRLYAFLLLFLVLLTSHLAQWYVVRNESWGSNGVKMASHYFLKNLSSNTIYYFDGKEFPFLFSFLALSGLFWKGLWKTKLYVVLWFLLSWGVFLFFYAGGYQYGVDVRYSILSMPPIALLAGWGASRLITVGQRWVQTSNVTAVLCLSLGVTLLLYLPVMHAFGQETWQCRADHVAAEEFAKMIPEDGIILTHNPNMFQIWGKNAAQMSLFTKGSLYAAQVLRPRFHDKIYLHWNYWCNTQDPVQVSFCQNVFSSYETQLIAEKKVDDQRYALYRILGDRLAPPMSKKN